MPGNAVVEGPVSDALSALPSMSTFKVLASLRGLFLGGHLTNAVGGARVTGRNDWIVRSLFLCAPTKRPVRSPL